MEGMQCSDAGRASAGENDHANCQSYDHQSSTGDDEGAEVDPHCGGFAHLAGKKWMDFLRKPTMRTKSHQLDKK